MFPVVLSRQPEKSRTREIGKRTSIQIAEKIQQGKYGKYPQVDFAPQLSLLFRRKLRGGCMFGVRAFPKSHRDNWYSARIKRRELSQGVFDEFAGAMLRRNVCWHGG